MFGRAEHFGRGHYGEHSCEIILNLDQWFRRRCRLKKKFMHDGRWPITLAHLVGGITKIKICHRQQILGGKTSIFQKI